MWMTVFTLSIFNVAAFKNIFLEIIFKSLDILSDC